MKRLRIIVVCACVMFGIFFTMACASVSAAAPKGPSRAAELAKMIAPFVDEQTIVVIHADLTKVDPGAILDMIQRDVLKMDEDKKRGAADEKKRMIGIHTALVKAGVRDVFAVVSLVDIPPKPFFMLIPVTKGMDVRAVRGLMHSGKADGPVAPPADQKPDGRTQLTQVVNGAVVRARLEIHERLKTMTPHSRPDMAKAFAAVEGTAAQALLLPTDDNRRVIEEMMPELPSVWGGGPSTVITRGVRWGAVGAECPPKGSVKLVIQSQGAKEAKALREALDRIVAGISTDRQVKRVLGDPKKVFAGLMPKVVGDQLRLSMSQKELLKTLAPSLVKARSEAELAASRSYIKGIYMGATMYAADHNGAMPDNIDAIKKGEYIPAKILANPRYPRRKGPGYVYIKPAGKLTDLKAPGTTIVLYEKLDKWEPGGICVGFADGHTEIIKDEKRFKEMLAASTRASTQPSKKESGTKK